MGDGLSWWGGVADPLARAESMESAGDNCMLEAAASGDLAALGAFLPAAAAVDAYPSPLSEACRHGQLAAVRLLLDNGPAPDWAGEAAQQAVEDAAIGGHADVLRELHGRGAVSAACVGGLLRMALQRDAAEAARFLLPLAAPPVAGNVLLAAARSAVEDQDLIADVMRLGAGGGGAAARGALLAAAHARRPQSVRVLLSEAVGAEPTDAALEAAVRADCVASATSLVEAGARAGKRHMEAARTVAMLRLLASEQGGGWPADALVSAAGLETGGAAPLAWLLARGAATFASAERVHEALCAALRVDAADCAARLLALPQCDVALAVPAAVHANAPACLLTAAAAAGATRAELTEQLLEAAANCRAAVIRPLVGLGADVRAGRPVQLTLARAFAASAPGHVRATLTQLTLAGADLDAAFEPDVYDGLSAQCRAFLAFARRAQTRHMALAAAALLAQGRATGGAGSGVDMVARMPGRPRRVVVEFL